MTLPPELRDEPPDEQAGSSGYVLSEHHTVALALRVPIFRADEQPGAQAKIAALEDYLLLAAFYVGVLQQERTEVYLKLGPKEQTWDDVDAGGKTGPERERGRARLRPALWRELKRLRWQVARLTETLDRLDREHDKVSRAYTLITGG